MHLSFSLDATAEAQLNRHLELCAGGSDQSLMQSFRAPDHEDQISQSNARLHACAARVHWMKGDLKRAMEYAYQAVDELRHHKAPCAHELCLLGQLQAHVALGMRTTRASDDQPSDSEVLLNEAADCFEAALEEDSSDENVRACLTFTHLRLGQIRQALEIAEGSWWHLQSDENARPPHMEALICALKTIIRKGLSTMPAMNLQEQQQTMQWAAEQIVSGGPLMWQGHSLLIALPWLLLSSTDRSVSILKGLSAFQQLGMLVASSPADWSPGLDARLEAAYLNLPIRPAPHHEVFWRLPKVSEQPIKNSAGAAGASPSSDQVFDVEIDHGLTSSRAKQPGPESPAGSRTADRNVSDHANGTNAATDAADREPWISEFSSSCPEPMRVTAHQQHKASQQPGAHLRNALALRIGQLLGWQSTCSQFGAEQQTLGPTHQHSNEVSAPANDQICCERLMLVATLALSIAMQAPQSHDREQLSTHLKRHAYASEGRTNTLPGTLSLNFALPAELLPELAADLTVEATGLGLAMRTRLSIQVCKQHARSLLAIAILKRQVLWRSPRAILTGMPQNAPRHKRGSIHAHGLKLTGTRPRPGKHSMRMRSAPRSARGHSKGFQLEVLAAQAQTAKSRPSAGPRWSPPGRPSAVI